MKKKQVKKAIKSAPTTNIEPSNDLESKANDLKKIVDQLSPESKAALIITYVDKDGGFIITSGAIPNIALASIHTQKTIFGYLSSKE